MMFAGALMLAMLWRALGVGAASEVAAWQRHMLTASRKASASGDQQHSTCLNWLRLNAGQFSQSNHSRIQFIDLSCPLASCVGDSGLSSNTSASRAKRVHCTCNDVDITPRFAPLPDIPLLPINRLSALPRTQDFHQRPPKHTRHHLAHPRHRSTRARIIPPGRTTSPTISVGKHKRRPSSIPGTATRGPKTSYSVRRSSPTAEEQGRCGCAGRRSVRENEE